MKGSLGKLLVVAIGLIQSTRQQETKTGQPLGKNSIIADEFISLNWTLADNETEVTYSRNFLPSRFFAYITHDPPKNYCMIKVMSTDPKVYSDKLCRYNFNVSDGSKVIIDSVRVYASGKMFAVSFSWYDQAEKDKLRIGSVDIVTCPYDDWSLWRGSSPSAGQTEKTATPMTKEIDMSKVKISKGYHFIDKNNKDRSKVHINFADHASANVKLVGRVKNEDKPGIKRESLAREKYGVCWINYLKITCSQAPIEMKNDPSELTEWATLTLPKAMDWFGVHNHNDTEMFVAGGKCSGKICDEFDIYKFRNDGTVSSPIPACRMNLRCAKPSAVTMDIMYDDQRKTTCFNMVCLDRPKLEYRRFCVPDQIINSV